MFISCRTTRLIQRRAGLIKKAILLILVISTVFLVIIEVTWSLTVFWEKNGSRFRLVSMGVCRRQSPPGQFYRKLASSPFPLQSPTITSDSIIRIRCWAPVMVADIPWWPNVEETAFPLRLAIYPQRFSNISVVLHFSLWKKTSMQFRCHFLVSFNVSCSTMNRDTGFGWFLKFSGDFKSR